MITFTATEIKNKTGQFMESVLKGIVQIQKSGRPMAVVLPQEEYERLTAIEDAYWAQRAQRAQTKGYASETEVAKLIKSAKHA